MSKRGEEREPPATQICDDIVLFHIEGYSHDYRRHWTNYRSRKDDARNASGVRYIVLSTRKLSLAAKPEEILLLRQLCFEKVLAGRQAPLELLGLWFNESDGSVLEGYNPVMIAKSTMRSSYISLLSFWYDASEIKDSLVTDSSWYDLSSTWQCLLPSEKQRLLPGHGVVTRTAAIASSDPMILR